MITGFLASFLLACLVYYLFDLVINRFVKRPDANDTMHLLLLIVCIVIAFGAPFLFKI